MIKLSKRPLPPQPITSEKHYQSDPNFSAIVEDCFGKCYICENDTATTLNVEHRVPHRGKDSIKYDWRNLFLSCGHCNSIKSDSYDDIIDPTQRDPEDCIALSLETNTLMENVKIEALVGDKSVLQTVALLGFVYNGGTTVIKDLESAHLRNTLSFCLARFYQYIEAYRKEPELGYDVIIKKEISRSSAFSAFKRGIVRNDAELSLKFGELIV